jgi:hypothetical protein
LRAGFQNRALLIRPHSYSKSREICHDIETLSASDNPDQLGCPVCLSPVSACDLSQNSLKIDRSGNAEMQDYRDALAPREAGVGDEVSGSEVPELQSYVADNPEKYEADAARIFVD